MKMLFAAARECGCGTKLPMLDVCYTVAVGGKRTCSGYPKSVENDPART